MNIQDYEQLCISIVLRWPETQDNIATQMVMRIADDSFGENGVVHKIIWRTISHIIINGRTPTIPAILTELGGESDSIGGEDYLIALHDFSKQMKVNTYENWETYTKVVYTAGKLRQLGHLFEGYYDKYADFDKLVAETDNVEEFIFNAMNEVQKIIGTSVDDGYKDISDAVDSELEKLEQIALGVKDILVCGVPALENYGIPAPKTFGVIIGMRSMGKTAFAFNSLALGKAIHLFENKLPGVVALNSLETPGEIIVRRMACALGSIDSKKVRMGQLSEEENEKYRFNLEYVRSLPLTYDDSPILTTEQMSMRAISQNVKKKRVLGISDYAELFADTTGGNEEQRVASIVRNVRSIAWLTGSCEVLLSQVNNNVLLHKSYIAGIDKARYSGMVAHAADWAIEIWNPKQISATDDLVRNFQCPDSYLDYMAYGLIEKNKNGPLGHFELKWDAPFTRFTDITNQGVGTLFDFRNAEGSLIEREEVKSDY